MKNMAETLTLTDNEEKRIMVFDDNLEILALCQIFFTKLQYQVKTMPRCENVLDDVKRYKPHLILMDLWIPEIGGEKSIVLLKGDPITNSIPVFLFSANCDIKQISLRVNADGYITKPFNLKELKEKIENQIKSTVTN